MTDDDILKEFSTLAAASGPSWASNPVDLMYNVYTRTETLRAISAGEKPNLIPKDEADMELVDGKLFVTRKPKS